MFVVWVGALLTFVLFVQAVAGGGEAAPGFILAISLLAVVHGALRQLRRGPGGGPGQGSGRHPAQGAQGRERHQAGGRVLSSARGEQVSSSALARGDLVLVEAGEFIPADGEVIVGAASVDESAITGESAPVIRESGGDRSAVTGGTRVLSDWLIVRVTAQPGETFLDRMIAMVEGAKRQKTPNEIALNILLAALTIIFLMVVVTLRPMSQYSVDAAGNGECGVDHHPRRPARVPGSHHHRRPAVGHRHRRA